ncbi:DsbA family protein, partial [Patescibacteria group bacterium]|nr:DsbA family protein [Patescibacteria group bacterium]
ADFQCPACATNNPLIEQAVEEYKDKLLFVYRNFPLPQHNWAELAARIGVAAYNQGKFMEMSSELYQNQSEWESSSNAEKLFLKYAESLRLDMDKFKKDLASSETKNLIEAQKQEASQAGINSTPTIFLNKVKIQPRSYNDLKQLIENELKK